MKTNDYLWKADVLITDVLVLFYTHADEIFDFDKPIESLEKEFQALKLFGPEEEDLDKVKVVDKLYKVHLRDGTVRVIFLHIEVQGQKDKAFGRRMFDYYYHIRNKYGDEVVA
jgi:hypothetical protein